jgi:predicted phage-related endonuclease
MAIKAIPSTVGEVALPAPAQRALRELRELRAEADRLNDRRKVLEGRIKDALGDGEVGTVRGVPVVTYRKSIRSSLSATMVKKKYPEIVSECTEMREVRTLLLVDPS